MTIRELIQELEQQDPTWSVYATRKGDSLYVWDSTPGSRAYGYIFTDGRAPRMLMTRHAHHNNNHTIMGETTR
jgi:hypothetical protein